MIARRKSIPHLLPFALAAGLVLCLAAGCPRTAKLAQLRGDAVVLAFGDSLTYGTGATEEESYPAVLERLIKRKVVRSGVPGELSGEGLMRLSGELDRVHPSLVILCHGGNDLLRRTDEAGTEANLRAMVQLAKGRGVDVVLIAVPRPGIWLVAAEYYDKIARESKVTIETAALANILTDNNMKSDLTHPNAAGYRKLAEAVAVLLRKAGAL